MTTQCTPACGRGAIQCEQRASCATMGFMDEFTQRVLRDSQARRLARIVSAKTEAPADKQPLDVAFVTRNARTSALGKMPDEELVLKLEELYYVDHPSYRTNQQLVDLIQQLADYE